MASQIIKTEVHIDMNAIGNKLKGLLNDDKTMLEIHNLFADKMEPYVPFGPGENASIQVTPEYVKYDAPYAHYHYEGIVYGPNIPIIEDGIVVGWFSIPDKPKHPTGAELKFKKAKASAHWDQAMMAEKREEFTEEVRQILARRARELYG